MPFNNYTPINVEPHPPSEYTGVCASSAEIQCPSGACNKQWTQGPRANDDFLTLVFITSFY